MEKLLIDIHSHHFSKQAHLQFIVGLHSLGVHPWQLQSDLKESEFSKLKKTFSPKILAIGECGLDRRKQGIVDIISQEKVLKWHMDWAREVKRPLIVHCVHAHSDFLKVLKELNYCGKILLHEYSGNSELLKSYSRYDTYYSFGANWLKSTTVKKNIIKLIETNRIFLETDDQINISIKELYLEASLVLGLELERLEDIILKNLGHFFSDLDNISSSDIINNLRVGPNS